MIGKKLLLVFLLSFSLFGLAQSQNKKVFGVVTDTSNVPLANVSIVASNKKGTTTDIDGKFELYVEPTSSTLEISRVGYITQKVQISFDEPMTIILNSSKKNDLDEVIVVGVQRQTKRNTIASVSGITSKDIENRPVASVDVLLQGRISGLNVQVSSGEPGVAPTVVVRGNSNVSKDIGDVGVAQSTALSGPLYVIDGIPMNPADLSNNGMDATGSNYIAGININDIADVQVQKDAIARRHGVRVEQMG